MHMLASLRFLYPFTSLSAFPNKSNTHEIKPHCLLAM